MECYPTYEQNVDVVFTVHWDCLGSETVNNITYTGRVYGSTGVTYHSGSEFTPYEQLTQNQVLFTVPYSSHSKTLTLLNQWLSVSLGLLIYPLKAWYVIHEFVFQVQVFLAGQFLWYE